MVSGLRVGFSGVSEKHCRLERSIFVLRGNCGMLQVAVRCCALLCCVMLSYVGLGCVVLCCAVLCCGVVLCCSSTEVCGVVLQ